MTYQGVVQNGVIVIPDGPVLSEGTVVSVVVTPSQESTTAGDDGLQNAPEGETLGQKMVRIAMKHANRSTDLPVDLAENHDHYIHGTPKRT